MTEELQDLVNHPDPTYWEDGVRAMRTAIEEFEAVLEDFPSSTVSSHLPLMRAQLARFARNAAALRNVQ